jgi:Tol biopolymer transport system component/C-terminal processing protease CtpA/Prc
MLKRNWTGLIALCFIPLAACAANEPLWLRYPAISPDGAQIAFCYRGDIYLVPTKGGLALPLVAHTAHDFMPVWSRDGKSVAFASDRHGNFDVFVVSALGGEPRRLTFNSAHEYPSDFSPDGKFVLFSAQRRDSVVNAQFPMALLPELYQAPVAGGAAGQVLTTPAQDARFDRAGKRLLYHDRKGYEDEWRKHHVSSITRDLWLCGLSSGKHTKLTDFRGEDRNPVWGDDDKEVYYLSEKSGSFNVWRMLLNQPDKAEQLTQHRDHPVRFLSRANNGTLCYSFNGELYILAPRARQPRKVQVLLNAAAKQNEVLFVTHTSDATEMAVSPQGKELAVVVRGEIFVASIDHKITRRITSTPEQERSVSFSPDGRTLLYAGERDGSWNLYTTTLQRTQEQYFFHSTLLKEEVLLKNGQENFQPRYSPDGKEVAYLENRTTLKILKLQSNESRTVLAGDLNYSYGDGDQKFDWSPDGRWLLTHMLDKQRWSREIALVDAAGKQPPVNLTRNAYEDDSPKWMMDGKMMIWETDRRGMRSHGSWGAQSDVYGMFFTQEAFDRFKLSKAEFELLTEREKKEKKPDATKKDEPKNDGEAKTEAKDGEKKTDLKADEKKKKVEPVKIEMQGIEDRSVRLTVHSSDLADAVLTPDGDKLLYLARFEKGHDLWLQKPREQETKLLAKLGAEGGRLILDKDAKHVFVLAGGKVTKVEVESGKQEGIAFSGEMELNRRAEHACLFEHVWRQVLRKFYVEDLHGVNWTMYKTNYARFLPHLDDNWDFAELLSELLGELNASHTGGRHRPAPHGDATACLGLFYDDAYAGPGLKVAEVIEKGPLQKSGSKIKAGVIIEQIDGARLDGETDPDALLNRKAGKLVLLSLFDPQAGQRWEETIKPISKSDEDELLYQRWIKSRREAVEKLSDGKLGYVHVRSMSDGGFRDTYAEALGRHSDKEGMIIDTRFNGGGWLHDDLVTLFSGKTYYTFIPRGNVIGKDPQQKWRRKSIVLMSESNYSNAHMFPQLYKAMGLGDLVGMPVPGTGTAVWWETLQDRSLIFGIPQVGVKDSGGRYLENQELEPDHLINNDPESLAKGRDRQLEKAVEILLSK